MDILDVFPVDYTLSLRLIDFWKEHDFSKMATYQKLLKMQFGASTDTADLMQIIRALYQFVTDCDDLLVKKTFSRFLKERRYTITFSFSEEELIELSFFFFALCLSCEFLENADVAFKQLRGYRLLSDEKVLFDDLCVDFDYLSTQETRNEYANIDIYILEEVFPVMKFFPVSENTRLWVGRHEKAANPMIRKRHIRKLFTTYLFTSNDTQCDSVFALEFIVLVYRLICGYANKTCRKEQQESMLNALNGLAVKHFAAMYQPRYLLLRCLIAINFDDLVSAHKNWESYKRRQKDIIPTDGEQELIVKVYNYLFPTSDKPHTPRRYEHDVTISPDNFPKEWEP